MLSLIYFLTLHSEEKIHFLIPPHLPLAIYTATQTLLAPAALPPVPPTPSPIKWVTPSSSSSTDLPILTLHMPASSGVPKQIAWHRRGDYLASVCKLVYHLE